jgi:UPF0042 nucleotide-binding protein
VLEDLGWEAIDNFPIRLLEGLIDNPDFGAHSAPLAIGSICARGASIRIPSSS